MHDRVRTNHDELNQIARLFGEQAEASARTLAALRRQKDVLQGGDWVGQGARKFYEEMDASVFPALTRLQRALSQAQQVTGRIGVRMRQCEAEAARQLQDREPFNGQPGGSGSDGSPGSGGTDGSGSSGGGFGAPFANAQGEAGWSGGFMPSTTGSGGVAQGAYAVGNAEAGLSGIGKVTAAGRVLGGEAGYGWNRDVQGAYAEGSVLQGSVGLQLGEGEGFYRQSLQVDVLAGSGYVGHRGSNYGIGAEINTIKVTGGQVIGTKDIGLTTGGEVAGPSANAYAGVKDGSIGAEAGYSLAGVKAEGGFNVFGWNIGLVGEADLGAGIGASIGRKTSIKFGPLAIGITFGSAK